MPTALARRDAGERRRHGDCRGTGRPRGVTKPKLVFFTSARSGNCRRVEGFLAQVLQRRRNHGTFRLLVVDEHERPDLVARFKVTEIPTLVVVDGRKEQARLESPRGCRDIEALLAPWLR